LSGLGQVMHFLHLRIIPHKALALWIALMVSSLPLFVCCSDSQEPAVEKPQAPGLESFTFFNLGNNTKLTKAVRDDLEEKLGRGAIERRSILNLEINYNGFLKKYFPELDRMNQKVNYPPRERVDHNTVKLMYRYAQKKNVPFEFVELIFSDYTGTPILFRINFKKDEAGIIETLEQKYGKPEIIDWQEENGQSRFWKQNNDYLIISRVPDQFGNPEYNLVIFYIDNLKNLIETERKEKEQKQQQRAKTVRKAF
jgi:hypothetical protein